MALMTITSVTEILIYLCVLAIKTCNVSQEVCLLFGFGDSAEGAENNHVLGSLWSALTFVFSCGT